MWGGGLVNIWVEANAVELGIRHAAGDVCHWFGEGSDSGSFVAVWCVCVRGRWEAHTQVVAAMTKGAEDIEFPQYREDDRLKKSSK
jgi:hypothetical protein